MTKNEDTSLPGDPSNLNAVTVQSAGAMEYGEPGQAPISFWGEASKTSSADVFSYLHSLRRRWGLVVGLGLLCAALVGPAAWIGQGARYTAASYLRVATSQTPLVYETAEHRGRQINNAFDIYKGTQQQLVTSRFVLTAALRSPDVANLPSVKREKDPVVWLAKELKVRFPGEAEIMEVALTGNNPEETATLVRAVVTAYDNEVVNVEGNLRRARLSELDRLYTEKEQEVRERRTELKQLAETLGTSDREALSVKQQMALQQLSSYRRELATVQFSLMRSEGDLRAGQMKLQAVVAEEVSEIELDAFAQKDVVARQLFEEMNYLQSDARYTENIVVPGSRSRAAERYLNDHNRIRQLYDERRAELLAELRRQRAREVKTLIDEHQIRVAILREQEERLQQDVAEQTKEIASLGGQSIDVEMARAEIDQLDTVLEGIANEREKLKVELRSTSRIQVIQRAEIPTVPVNLIVRASLAAMGMLLAFIVPAAMIVWWDTSTHRVNSSLEVTNKLGLPVIGTVQMVPAQAIRQLGSPSRRHLKWHARLTESADAVAARLLRKSELDDTRVVLTTSAMGGEAKTTLTTQLAMSLARSERKVVLVDFDLRRPSFQEIFGVPLTPGVSEVLRGEADMSEVVRETSADNLSVVTAGRWDRRALTALANGKAAPLFEVLREQYDFVLVDASPVLPVADTRFVSQHVDAVLLSVLRDVSQGPKISAACEILRAFGVEVLDAVVTGPSDVGHRQNIGYEPRIPE